MVVGRRTGKEEGGGDGRKKEERETTEARTSLTGKALATGDRMCNSHVSMVDQGTGVFQPAGRIQRSWRRVNLGEE